MYKVIFIDRISEHSEKLPSSIKDGDNYFTVGWGGISARKFKEFNPDVRVECWKTDYKAQAIYKREISGVQFRIFPAYNFKYYGDYSKSLMQRLKKDLKKNEPTIIHLTSIRYLLFYNIFLKLKKYPLVVQNNGESSALYKFKISKGLKKLFYAVQIPLQKILFRNIDLLYILDDRLREFLPETTTKIKKQTLGVMPERFIPLNKKEAKHLLNLDTNKKHILYIGKLNFTKRPDILIDTFKEIKKERDNVELLIVGTNEEDPLINYAVQAGAKVYGRILHTEIYKYLSAADVYILAKYSKEHIFGGIGLLPVEALLCNTPVIGGSLKNFPQEDREAVGFVAEEPEEMKNSIIQIIDKKISFNELREIAIKHYSWEKIVEQTSNDFRELIKYYY